MTLLSYLAVTAKTYECNALAPCSGRIVARARPGRPYDASIAHTRRWLALDSLNERAHRALMQLYAQARQLEQALALIGLVYHHRSSFQESKNRLSRLEAKLGAGLSLEQSIGGKSPRCITN